MKKQDLLTNEEFVSNRTNQRFAKPENRIKYWNNKANELRRSIAHISKPLHSNFQILNELMSGKNDATYHKQFLLGKGFNFSVHTHVEEFEGQNHYAVYEYVIIALENHQIKIINNG